jgi:hypothetical protein
MTGVSFAPALLAAGLMLIVWGAIGYWPVTLGGVALSGLAIYRWIVELNTGEIK